MPFGGSGVAVAEEVVGSVTGAVAATGTATGVVVLGIGVEGVTLAGAVGVELGDVVTDGGPGGVAAASVIGAGGPVVGPVAGPVRDEVGTALEGVALDVETGEVVLGTWAERITALTGTVAVEPTEAGKLAEPVEPAEASKLADPAELTTAGVAPAALATGIAAGVTTAGSPLSSSAVVAAGGAAARGTGVGLPETDDARAASDLPLAVVSAGSLITS